MSIRGVRSGAEPLIRVKEVTIRQVHIGAEKFNIPDWASYVSIGLTGGVFAWQELPERFGDIWAGEGLRRHIGQLRNIRNIHEVIEV